MADKNSLVMEFIYVLFLLFTSISEYGEEIEQVGGIDITVAVQVRRAKARNVVARAVIEIGEGIEVACHRICTSRINAGPVVDGSRWIVILRGGIGATETAVIAIAVAIRSLGIVIAGRWIGAT